MLLVGRASVASGSLENVLLVAAAAMFCEQGPSRDPDGWSSRELLGALSNPQGPPGVISRDTPGILEPSSDLQGSLSSDFQGAD